MREPASGATPARPQLPVDSRVTPESLAAYAEAATRPRFPIGAVACGVLIAWLTLPVWFLFLAMLLSGSVRPPPADGMLLFVVATLGVGIVPAAGLALPLGALLVRALRGVRSRRWHALAVLTLGASIGALGALALPLEGSWGFVPAVGLAALTGWWVVHRRLARASESCAATSRAAGE